MPSRYSRHYYDLYQLANSKTLPAALGDLHLLKSVVDFKRRFYPSGWAKYKHAFPGTFRLLPKREHLPDLRRDYREMIVMFYEPTPDFDSILEALGGAGNRHQ